MSNVTVNIQGNRGSGSGGGRETPPPSDNRPNNPITPDNNQNRPNNPPVNTPSPRDINIPGTSSVNTIEPPNNRLIDEVRTTILQEGAIYIPGNNSYRPIVDQAEKVERSRINERITDKYNGKREESKTRLDSEYNKIDEEIDEGKQRAIEKITDPLQREQIENLWENKRNKRFRTTGESYENELEGLNKSEKEEKLKAEDELSRVIKDLSEEIKRSGGALNPNSFLSQLKQERQRAIVERDTAEDEDTSRAAAKRVRDLDKKISDVVEGKPEKKDIDYGTRSIQTLMGFDQIARGITNKDLGSIIMGGGQSVTSMLGMDDKAAARSLAFLKPLATIGTLLTQEAQKSDQMAGLAALIRGGGNIADTRQGMYKKMWDYSPYSNGQSSIYDMGLSVPEFAQSSEKRIKQRGIAQGGVSEAYFQEALERVFSLDSGSLGQAGKYDRYGVNSTDAISNLVERLSRIQNSGVSQNNYARVQEYLTMQQDLMGQYSRFQDKPSYGVANNNLSAFAQLRNYTVDTRTSGEIKTVENQLINPQNDRMKALLYSTVEDMFPESRGRTDIIDRYLHDPRKMGMINRSNMQKLTNMYGGYDTPMGYWMIQSQLQGIESPERRKSIWEGITNGQAGRTLASYNTFSASGAKDEYATQVKGYNSELTKGLIKMSDGVYAGVSSLESIAETLTKVMTGQGKLFDLISKIF